MNDKINFNILKYSYFWTLKLYSKRYKWFYNIDYGLEIQSSISNAWALESTTIMSGDSKM